MRAETAQIADRYRPRYHFLPPRGWMNDPNGLIQWNGVYHLFYQHNPDRADWGLMRWGHASSRDLVHWEHLPIALEPTPDSPDQDGCFSGCAVDADGTPTIIYTGVRGEKQLPCIATGDGDLVTWEKYSSNPVIGAPPDADLVMFRDTFAWRESDAWYQVVGSGLRGVGGAALLYRSPDLRTWEYLHPLLVGNRDQTEPIWSGWMWECPTFVPLGDRHVLIVCAHDDSPHYPVYFAGAYAGHRLHPETTGRVDLGPSLYAPQAMIDQGDRCLLWGWLREARAPDSCLDDGWSGVLSLPRVLSPAPDGRVLSHPAPELQELRLSYANLTDVALAPRRPLELPDAGTAIEMLAVIEPRGAREIELAVFRARNGEEETRLRYDVAETSLVLDTTHSSRSPACPGRITRGRVGLDADGQLRLHLFLDRSVLEVFAHGEAASARVYPTLGGADVALRAGGGGAQLHSLDVWQLASIWT